MTQDTSDNHGTAVAGVAAARGNNGIGVSGAAQNVRILPVKVAQGGAYLNFDRIATAIYYAAGRKADGSGTWDAADILNMSFGAGGVTSHAAMDAAMNWASTAGRSGKGATTFAAAGNSAAGQQGSGREQYNTVVSLSNIAVPSGTRSWVIRYDKAGVGTGDDNIRLGSFKNTDGFVTRFDSLTPANWTPTAADWNLAPSFAQYGWIVEDNPSRAYGTGRYQVKSSAIPNDAEAMIMAPPVTTTLMSMELRTWFETESNDVMEFGLYNHGTAQLFSLTDSQQQDIAYWQQAPGQTHTKSLVVQ